MNRCTKPHTSHHHRLRRTARASLAALALALGGISALPSLAQTATFAPFQGPVRAFPPQALRGNLVVTSTSQATIDGQTVGLAPAFKLYNPRNTTIRPGTVLNERLTVNYVIEKTSGRVHAAWILNSEEAALKRDRADNGFWSGLFK
ncbi:hypothetical protein [Comamonas squillarum]|jgi:hypothetical protein|uniref:Uncharacterized protein n=1 Tax=Comamonas squillarum TaxID=2977320 RepID=A0ABY6A063_9BURK|nr:hypothetical protein [Comamonas sp. PR12]UXC18104.1 hypothetical protein N4T19_20825 [Comamonas sp. PR12]